MSRAPSTDLPLQPWRNQLPVHALPQLLGPRLLQHSVARLVGSLHIGHHEDVGEVQHEGLSQQPDSSRPDNSESLYTTCLDPIDRHGHGTQ